jgi:hypothetical protein
LLEGFDRILVVGGDEDDLGQQVVVLAAAAFAAVARRQLRDLPRGVDAGQAGHADVEEDDVGPVLVDQCHGLDAVLRLGNDFQVGPDLEQTCAQLVAHQAFVVGQHRPVPG